MSLPLHNVDDRIYNFETYINLYKYLISIYQLPTSTIKKNASAHAILLCWLLFSLALLLFYFVGYFFAPAYFALLFNFARP